MNKKIPINELEQLEKNTFLHVIKDQNIFNFQTTIDDYKGNKN
jgi:hypothetical protein